jgi:hypothetical protein
MVVKQREEEIERLKLENAMLVAERQEKVRELELELYGMEDQLRQRDWTVVQIGRLCGCDTEGMRRLREVIESGTFPDLRDTQCLPEGRCMRTRL